MVSVSPHVSVKIPLMVSSPEAGRSDHRNIRGQRTCAFEVGQVRQDDLGLDIVVLGSIDLEAGFRVLLGFSGHRGDLEARAVGAGGGELISFDHVTIVVDARLFGRAIVPCKKL